MLAPDWRFVIPVLFMSQGGIPCGATIVLATPAPTIASI